GVGDPWLPRFSGAHARPPSVGEAGGLEPARDRESGSPGVADREAGDPRGTFLSAILALSPGRGGTAVGWRVAHRDSPEGKSRRLRHHCASSSNAETPTVTRLLELIKGVVSDVVGMVDLDFPPLEVQ